MIARPITTILHAWRVARTVLVLAFAAGVAVHCAGCGGALLAQARAATIATVALEGGRRMIVEVAEQRSAECEDEACVIRVREEMRPVEAAYEGLRLSLSAWVAGLDLGALAGVGDELLPSLMTAGMRFVVDWQSFADALRALGVEVPSLPAGMLSDVGAP